MSLSFCDSFDLQTPFCALVPFGHGHWEIQEKRKKVGDTKKVRNRERERERDREIERERETEKSGEDTLHMDFWWVRLILILPSGSGFHLRFSRAVFQCTLALLSFMFTLLCPHLFWLIPFPHSLHPIPSNSTIPLPFAHHPFLHTHLVPTLSVSPAQQNKVDELETRPITLAALINTFLFQTGIHPSPTPTHQHQHPYPVCLTPEAPGVSLLLGLVLCFISLPFAYCPLQKTTQLLLNTWKFSLSSLYTFSTSLSPHIGSSLFFSTFFLQCRRYDTAHHQQVMGGIITPSTACPSFFFTYSTTTSPETHWTIISSPQRSCLSYTFFILFFVFVFILPFFFFLFLFFLFFFFFCFFSY